MPVPTPPVPGEPVPKRTAKAPSESSQTGQIYAKLFFLPDEAYPFKMDPMSRGKAINMSVGLNRCNKAFYDKQGAPEAAMTLSAKAKAVAGPEEEAMARAACRAGLPVPPCGLWYVEISKSYRRCGELPPSRKAASDWMAGILSQIQGLKTASEVQAEKRQVKYQKGDQALEAWLAAPEPSSKLSVEDAMAKAGYSLEEEPDHPAPTREISPEEGLALLAAERAKARGEQP